MPDKLQTQKNFVFDFSDGKTKDLTIPLKENYTE